MCKPVVSGEKVPNSNQTHAIYLNLEGSVLTFW